MAQDLSFSPLRFALYAKDLSEAVFRLSRETSERTRMATIAEQLRAARAQVAKAREQAATCVAESAEASRAVLQEIDKARKEAASLLAEIAELTNGAPPLDDTPKANVTPLPPVGPAVSYP